MPPTAGLLDRADVGEPAALLDETPAGVDIRVHDASRLGWTVTVPLSDATPVPYAFELELEVPTNLVGLMDPWAALQSNARLDRTPNESGSEDRSVEAFRRAVVTASSRLARAREGFIRHSTLIRASATDEDHWRPLALWVAAASAEIANARSGLLRSSAHGGERALADEFLSVQLWTVLTDCGRALFDTRRILEERDGPDPACFDQVESALGHALREELAYRHEARFALAEPASTAQLERLLARMRWLKRHFERVLFLEVETYEVQSRLSGWFSAFAAVLAYLWFLFWQLTLERHPVAVGSGVVAFALITAIAYASRERIKEVGRNWLAGRVQRMFAQRVTRYRLPRERPRTAGPVIVSARESFSQSSAQKSDPAHGHEAILHDITLLRFIHRGVLAKAPAARRVPAKQVLLIYRFDLSALFPRLHDAVRGFASLDKRTKHIAIVDVPRNYQLPVRARLRWNDAGRAEIGHTLVLNKNGLLRIET
jgi:hypothetical protein